MGGRHVHTGGNHRAWEKADDEIKAELTPCICYSHRIGIRSPEHFIGELELFIDLRNRSLNWSVGGALRGTQRFPRGVVGGAEVTCAGRTVISPTLRPRSPMLRGAVGRAVPRPLPA